MPFPTWDDLVGVPPPREERKKEKLRLTTGGSTAISRWAKGPGLSPGYQVMKLCFQSQRKHRTKKAPRGLTWDKEIPWIPTISFQYKLYCQIQFRISRRFFGGTSPKRWGSRRKTEKMQGPKILKTHMEGESETELRVFQSLLHINLHNYVLIWRYCPTELMFEHNEIHWLAPASKLEIMPQRPNCLILRTMGWLQLVGSFKLYVSFAEYRLWYRALLQRRSIRDL